MNQLYRPKSSPDDTAQLSAGTPLLSIVAPCHNEQLCLTEFHRQVSAVARNTVGASYEIVLVDDGSTDLTPGILRDMADRDPHVVVVRLSRNFGHQKALTAGLHLCRGDRVLILDADLQDPPGLLPDMMRALDDGADVAFGQRRTRQGETAFKTASAKLFYRMLHRITDVTIPPDSGDFRLISRRVLEICKTMPEQSVFMRGMISWIGFRQVPVFYDRLPRHAGHTNYTLRKMLRFATDAVTGFSVAPLRLVTGLGALTSAASLLVACYAVLQWLRGDTVAGWTSLTCITLLVGGIQVLSLGILGEYIGRIYVEQKRRPLYVISEVYGRQQRNG